ncbi:MAG: tetratricopeptide repeat protein, partial [Candidatus Kapabacteria bacterium]|nr:tetratricopeptide repeat protein [Candidatus Kapabacteria bacterium]
VGNEDPTKPMVSKDSFEKTLENKSDIELYKIANDLYENDIKDVAIVVFQKCIERNYRIDSCYYKQGVSYITIGQLKIGVEKLEESLKINPKNYKACYNIGTTCYETQEYQKSIEYYEKALKLGFENDRVYYGIAASQFVLGQLKDAEINCLTALKLNPNNENAKTLWGYILIKREKR